MTYVLASRATGLKAWPAAATLVIRGAATLLTEKAEAVARRRAPTANFIVVVCMEESGESEESIVWRENRGDDWPGERHSATLQTG